MGGHHGGRPANSTPCIGCNKAMPPGARRAQGRCPTCASRVRRAGSPVTDDGRRELWTVESFGPGWYVRAQGAWWQVPAYENGWRRRKPAEAPTEGRHVSPHNEAVWMRWLNIPDATTAAAAIPESA